MGRALITQNIGEGLYEITYIKGRERRAAALAQIDLAIAGNQSAQTQQESAISVLEGQLATAIVALNNAIQSGDISAIKSETVERNRLTLRLRAARESLESLKITEGRMRAIRKNIALIEAEVTRQAWVADYSLDVDPSDTREFGTAEIAGTASEVILLPMGDKAEPDRWSLAEHGEVYNTDLVTPGTAYYAHGIFPGWQKYLPAYRLGRITRIDPDDTVDVELIEPTRSTEQGLPIAPTLANEQAISHDMLAVEYLDCGAAAFSVNDEVLIKYPAESRDAPVVIGFRQRPKPCQQIKVLVANGDFLLAGNGQWVFSERTPGPSYETTSWFNRQRRTAISWHGWRGRHVALADGFFVYPIMSGEIYSQGLLIATAPGLVIGACITFSGSQKEYILAVTTDQVLERFDETTITERVWRRPYEGDDTQWEEIGSHTWTNDPNLAELETLPNTDDPAGHYFFNASGTRAVSVKLATWRDPMTAGGPHIPWSREMSIDISGGGATFTRHAAQDAAAVTSGDAFTYSKVVARDFIDDVEVSASLESTYDDGSPTATLDRDLSTSQGYSTFLSVGSVFDDGGGPTVTANTGKVIQYLDLRVHPPVIVYRNMDNQTGFAPQDWSLRIEGLTGEDQVAPIQATAPLAVRVLFTNPLVSAGILNQQLYEFRNIYLSGTVALTDNDGVVLVDPEFIVNAMYPNGNINALSGLGGVVSPIGLG